MGLKQYIKRGVKFILHGVPERKVYAQVSYLAPSEMLKVERHLSQEEQAASGTRWLKLTSMQGHGLSSLAEMRKK